MARAAYIICSASSSVDQQTNRLSVFEIYELFEATRLTSGDGPQSARGPSLRIVAAWMREEDDSPDEEFESEITCLTPSGEPFFGSQITTFSFKAVYHRLYITDLTLPGFPSLGVYNIEGRLRKAGSQDWAVRQQFPFVVAEKDAATQSPPSAPVS